MRCSEPSAVAAARVFDGERVLDDHAVLVVDGAVSAVIPRRLVPPGMPVREEPGCTILPGLIDAHVHFMRWQGALFLASGVTTVRDVGNDLDWILARREEWPANPWPRILCTGPLLDGPKPIHRLVTRCCRGGADAAAAVREIAARGVDGIKLYVGLEADWLLAMAREAHDAGLKVSMHGARNGVLGPGRAGVDEFFHLDGILTDVWPIRPPGWLNVWGLPEFAQTWDRQREVADAIRALGMTATPTLAYWDSQWRVRTAEHRFSEEMRGVPPAIVEWQASQPPDPAASAQWRRALQAAQRFVGLLAERGVPLLAGSDVPCGAVPPGLSVWRELALLVESGLSPLQVLKAATSEAAAFMGKGQLGRLRPGSAADLVVVKGNPLERIPEKPEVVTVMRKGEVFRPADLQASAAAAVATMAEEPWGLQLEIQRPRSRF